MTTPLFRPPQNPPPSPSCANCGGSHTVAQCATPRVDGLVWGCPSCNVSSHQVDKCPRIDGQVALARWVIHSRGLMPPLRTEVPSHVVAMRVWDTPGFVPPHTFPWSTSFAQKKLTDRPLKAAVQAYYTIHDFDKNSLPSDPDTSSVLAVNHSFTISIGKKKKAEKRFRRPANGSSGAL